MRLLIIARQANIFNHCYPAELHLEDLDTPAPAAFTADIRKLLHRLAVANIGPLALRECGAYLPRARVCKGIFQISNLHQRFAYVVDFPSDDSVEPYRVSIYGSSGKPHEMLRPGGNMLVPDLINVEWEHPMKAWSQGSLVLAESSKDAALKWLEDNKEDQRLSEPLNDFEDAVEQIPISLYYPWG